MAFTSAARTCRYSYITPTRLPHTFSLPLVTGELRHGHTKALEGVAEGLMPRLRPVLDEVAAVRDSDAVHAFFASRLCIRFVSL